MELRPHHILGYFGHEDDPSWYELEDKAYVSKWRKVKRKHAEDSAREQGLDKKFIKSYGDWAEKFHSDEVILHARDVAKKLSDEPDTKFKYVSGLDSICERCDQIGPCHDKEDMMYNHIKRHDEAAIKELPELEHGKTYDGHYLQKLWKKRKKVG